MPENAAWRIPFDLLKNNLHRTLISSLEAFYIRRAFPHKDNETDTIATVSG